MALSFFRRCPFLLLHQTPQKVPLIAPTYRLIPQKLLSSEPPKQTEIPKNSVNDMKPSDLPQRKPARGQNKTPISWKSLGLTVAAAGVLLQVLWTLKEKKKNEIDRNKVFSIGKAAIGGDFELVDTSNKPVGLKDFAGKWVLIYFGFTHCPDICPEELEKMTEIINIIDKTKGAASIQPLFISVDPERDTPELISKYTAEFSPRLLGLTGTVDQIKDICKKYRIYYSAGPKEDGDYIVDHTIIMYLLNPKGEFQQYYGRNKTAAEISRDIIVRMASP